jgi:hypothetical protein
LPRLCGFPLPDLAERRSNRSAESSLRVRLPLEFCPANPSQLAATSRLLSWTLVPFSTLGFGSPLAAGVPHPATFRLQGLATLLTAYSFRARAGFVSPRQRSWDSPFGAFPSRKVSTAFPPRMNPPAVSPTGTAAAEAATRPGRPRLLGFHPSESPSRAGVCLARRFAGCSLGFPPFQGTLARALNRGLTRPPLTRLLEPSPEGRVSRRLRVSIGSHLVPPTSAGKPADMAGTTLLGFSHLAGPEHSGEASPGLCVHLTLCRALLPTSQRSLGVPTPCRNCSGSAEVPSLRDLNVATSRCGEWLVGSSRVFKFAARDAGVAAGGSSSCGVDVSSRVLCPPKYRRIG